MTACAECGDRGRLDNPGDLLGTETCPTCAGRGTIGPAGFACPACGEDDAWVAHYMIPESQSVVLLVGDEGRPTAEDYTGGLQHYDAEPDEYYECRECGVTVTLDGALRGPEALTVADAAPRMLDFLRRLNRTWDLQAGPVASPDAERAELKMLLARIDRVADADDGERLSCEKCGESLNVHESGSDLRCPRCA